MVDNFEEISKAIYRYIYANAPNGCERSLDRLEAFGNIHYICLEFHRPDVAMSLYIRLDSFKSKVVYDQSGDMYREFKLEASPAWPSLGSVDTAQASSFLKLLSEVVTFAKGLEAEFDQPILKFIESAATIEERKRQALEDKCRFDVQALMRTNCNGMRVGTERHVEVPDMLPDLLPVGCVKIVVNNKHYTTNVTSKRTICMIRTA